ncbi:MAG: hypothetical protein AAB665_03895 [Patescibacteria group bacterium]
MAAIFRGKLMRPLSSGSSAFSLRGTIAAFTVLALISIDVIPGFAVGDVFDVGDPPSEPVISSIAGDNYINASEASAVHIVGTADVGVSIIIDVSLSDSAGTRTATSSAPAIGGVFDVIVDASALLDGIITPLAITIDDDAGLESAATITPNATKDTAAPSVSITSGPAEGSATSSPDITFGFAAEDGATLTCLFDGAASAACNSSTSHASSSMADGSHSFSVAAADAAGNAATSSRTFSIDATKPVLAEVTAVPTPSEDTTPNYLFTTSEAGTISYGGSCSSATTTASSGENALTFDALAAGTFSDCTIRVADALGNESLPLNISSFTITSPPEPEPEPEPAPVPVSGGGGGGNGPVVGSFSTILSAPSTPPPPPAPAPALSVPMASEAAHISATVESAVVVGALAVAGGAVTVAEASSTKKPIVRASKPASEPVSKPASDAVAVPPTGSSPIVQSVPRLENSRMTAAAAEADLESRGLLRLGWLALIVFTILLDVVVLRQWMRYKRYRAGYEYAT